ADFKVTNLDATTGDNPFDVAVSAHLELQRAGVPEDGRFWIVGANAEEWLLRSDALTDPARGGSEALVRDNTLGRIRGFNVISASSLIEPNEVYFDHTSGVLVANVAPAAPFNVPDSEPTASHGLSVM